MQSARETSRQKRCNKRRNSRKKSLSPSDLKCVRDSKPDSKLNKRSLSEGSVKVKHKKSNIKRTLTHPFTGVDDLCVIGVFNSDVKLPPPESDESNLPPTSSDRDTEDDGKIVPRPVAYRPRWDSGSEMDSLVSNVVKRAARRRRTNPDRGVNYETGEASEPEAGRMRPEDYRLVFLSSDSSCREDTEDSSSTASSAAPPAPDDCDWDYFEPGAAARQPSPPPVERIPRPCPRQCSCGAEPRIVAVPVPVPVPVPAALWPALLAFPQTPPPPHWNTYPGFPPLDAAALARLTTAAAVAVTAAATATASASGANKLEMATVKTDKAIQSEASAPEPRDNDNDKNIERPIEREAAVGIKVITEEDLLSVQSDRTEAMPEHLNAEKAFPSSDESGDSSDSEAGVARRYDVTSGAPEEPATSDEDSEDSGGGGGGQFSRVFVVNPADSSSDLEDNADSSGIDCDDSYDKKSDSLEIIAVEAERQNDVNIVAESNDAPPQNDNDPSVVLLDSINFTEEYPMISYGNNGDEGCSEGTGTRSEFVDFCDTNMLQSETCETFNSFIATCSSSSDDLDNTNNTDSGNYRYRSVSENTDDGSSFNTSNTESDMKVKVVVELPNEKNSNEDAGIAPETLIKLAPSPEPSYSSANSAPVDKIDLFKGIERTLSELLKKELLEDQEEEKMHDREPVCSSTEGGACAPAETTVGRSRTVRTDGSARFTSRVMITHDRVSVVTSDTTRLMRDITVHHTNLQNELEPQTVAQTNETDERLSDDETAQPSGGVTVVSNADTLSAVVCLEEGLADDDSWVEDVSHDEDEATSPSDSDSGDEASLPTRGEEFAYCRRSIDFTLHTIVEESCEESETEQTSKKPRPISATELEKYFFFGLGDGRNVHDDEEAVSETSSVCSEGGESIPDNEQPKRSGNSDELVSSRLEKYFLSGFMGFNQERRDSDGSGSVGSDSEGRQSPEQRRKRLVRARGTPRSHSNSLDNLLAGDEPSQDIQEVSDGSSTETEDRHDSSERLDMQGENKRKKQNKKTRGSPADDRRQSAEFTEEARDDTRSVSEGEDGRLSPRPEFPPLGSELSESKKQTSRDSGFVGSCDDLLRNGDSSNDFRSHEPKTELEEITEEIRPDIEERVEGPPSSRPPQSPLSRKDSFNNWSSDEETNLMMTKMRQFFKQMVNTTNVRTSTPASSNSESSRPPKPPQLLYFESELTRLMKTVPGIRDEEVREIVEYLSSEDTWSDSYDSSDYAGSDLEVTANRSALRKQISESCREIINKFDNGCNDAGSLERDAAGAYRRLAATLGRAGEGSPPLFGKVMRHIGGRLVALMHEVSGGASPSTDDDSASEPGALARSRSHDILEAAASRGSVASDCERFSWRGSFESALLAADSRGTLGGGVEARRSPAGVELAAQRSHSRSCGAISGSEDRLWRGRRRASAADAESEEEQRAGSLPRLPSVTGTSAVPAGPVKSARYRAPGFRTATRAASAPGLHAPRRRRPPPTPQPPPAAPASAPSLQGRIKLRTMVSDTVDGSDAKTKVDAKESEVSCWNCFTTVTAENIAETEPATLPKIRRANRQKYKLYSFVASQLSKPKTIPLAQKVSENYAIGKKVEQRVAEKAVQTKVSVIEKIKNNVSLSDKEGSSIESEEDILKPENSANAKYADDDKEKKIQDYIKEYNLFEAYKSIRRKNLAPNSSLETTRDNIILDNSNVINNATNNTIENIQSPNYKKIEIVQPKITVRKIYESPSISITSSTYITKSQENIDENDSNDSQTTDLGKREIQSSSFTKQDKISPTVLFQSSIPKDRTISSSSLNKSYPSDNSLSGSIKSQHFVCKSLKIEEINKNKGQTSQVKSNTPSNSTDNIVHKVLIETSTPKLEKKIDSRRIPSPEISSTIKESKNQDDIDKIIEGIQNISLRTKEQTAADKIDNASSNGSESGYSGSSTRDLHDADHINKSIISNRHSFESGSETESPLLSRKRSPRPNLKSLPVLGSRHRDISASTKSLGTDSNLEVNKPVKKLRWSTLDLPHKPIDEVYISDSLSPGHATLPRRSNSPLPHERDMLDRDRFSLNRSGLQNRSESMASVYSGAGEGTRCNVTVRGEVQFSLLYNYRLGALEVGVKRCRDLAPVDTKRNRSDPYVKVYLLPDKSKAGKRKTKVKKNTLNPVFEETLSFAQPLASLSARTLWLSAWHADMFGRNDFLGEVALPLAAVVFDDPAPAWHKLHERTEQFDEQQGTRGDLIVGLKFELHETGALRGKGTLHVLVKEAKNLVATKPNGLADVFCKSYLLPERGRLVKQKTSVARRTLSPRWEQTFTYRGLKLQELSTRALELSLWDRDRLASNDFMGAVRLSLGSGTYMGANVNWMDSVGKEVTLWQTMMQRPNFWVEGSLPLRPQLSN